MELSVSAIIKSAAAILGSVEMTIMKYLKWQRVFVAPQSRTMDPCHIMQKQKCPRKFDHYTTFQSPNLHLRYTSTNIQSTNEETIKQFEIITFSLNKKC